MQTVTTQAARIFSVFVATTGAASHMVNIFKSTEALGVATTFLRLATPQTAGYTQWQSGAGGVWSSVGFQFAIQVNATSTNAITVGSHVSVEYTI